MTNHDAPRFSLEDFDAELTFGEAALARSERLLLQGKNRMVDGEVRLTYEWEVGWEYHCLFALSRPARDQVDPDTVYRLERQEKDPRNGRDSRVDFSQAQGIIDSEGFATSYDTLTARGKGITVPQLHQQTVLDMLASEARKDTGF
jgi:hypothetical protein